jgi:tetratricopeptide (TPR) repeat protein
MNQFRRMLCGCTALWPVLLLAVETPYAPLPANEVRQRIEAVLRARQSEPAVLAEAVKGLTDASAAPERLLAAALAAVGSVDSELGRLVADLERGDLSRVSQVEEYVQRPELEPFLAANLRALAGRRLAERRWYDEALEMLRPVDLRQTIDPAGVLFFRAVAAQGLFEVDAALTALDELLHRTERVPARYSATATLMEAELSRVKEKSLGEIARLMADSERRLDLGRTGEKVQGVQERIVAELDELIKKIEAQQSGGGGGSGSSSNSNESSGPASDSSVKGATAPGETDQKKFSKEGQWGDLPEKQQAEARNLINRNFPSHYRQAIETYFKKLAARPAPPPGK